MAIMIMSAIFVALTILLSELHKIVLTASNDLQSYVTPLFRLCGSSLPRACQSTQQNHVHGAQVHRVPDGARDLVAVELKEWSSHGFAHLGKDGEAHDS